MLRPASRQGAGSHDRLAEGPDRPLRHEVQGSGAPPLREGATIDGGSCRCSEWSCVAQPRSTPRRRGRLRQSCPAASGAASYSPIGGAAADLKEAASGLSDEPPLAPPTKPDNPGRPTSIVDFYGDLADLRKCSAEHIAFLDGLIAGDIDVEAGPSPDRGRARSLRGLDRGAASAQRDSGDARARRP